MKSKLRLFALLAVVMAFLGQTAAAQAADPIPVEPAEIESAQTDVVGGVEADRLEYPFIAQLVQANVKSDWNGAICGASAISDTWIVTAAHCVSKDPAKINIVLGTHDLRANQGHRVAVCDVAIHPKRGLNDIALVELCEPHYHPTIKLAQSADVAATGTATTVIGWGLSETPSLDGSQGKQVFPERPLEADVTVRSEEHCEGNDESGSYDHDRYVCAQGKGVDGVHKFADACNGDSGGPLITVVDGEPVLVGVVSYGPPDCGDRKLPGYYARVSNYLDWITETTGVDGTVSLAGVPCGDLFATHVGTDGDDKINGSKRADVIVAGAGNDVIKSKANDDTICAGDGDDIIRSGKGDDTIFAGPGNDTCKPGKGKDTLEGCS